MLAKLPTETQRNLARDHGSDKWIIDELQTAVLWAVRILEMGIENPISSQGTLPIPTASFHTNTDKKPPRNPTESQKKSTCVYCKRPHTPISCDAIREHQKQLDIIKCDKLCFNCLGHHKVTQCNSKYRCRKCNRKHHTSICSSTKDTAENKDPLHGNTEDTTALTTLAPSNHDEPFRDNVCLLRTAIATITTTDSEAEANILFDERSQGSFLTKDLADVLSLQPYKKEDICLSSFGTKHPLNKKMEVALITSRHEWVDLSRYPFSLCQPLPQL